MAPEAPPTTRPERSQRSLTLMQLSNRFLLGAEIEVLNARLALFGAEHRSAVLRMAFAYLLFCVTFSLPFIAGTIGTAAFVALVAASVASAIELSVVIRIRRLRRETEAERDVYVDILETVRDEEAQSLGYYFPGAVV